jgi:phosphoribosylformylglycinamidine synthase
VFKDNAGVIRFNDSFAIVFKVETHNSPSALDPYGGALTGIVGVNRDPFGTGQTHRRNALDASPRGR